MTILNQTEILECSYPYLTVGLFIVSVLALIIGFLVALIKYRPLVTVILFSVSLLCCVSSGILAKMTHPTGRYRYECLINEDTSIVEIYNRYNIVKQRGDIWVLEDKEE